MKKSFRSALLCASSLAMAQLPSFAYQLDTPNHVVNISPSATPAATTSDVRSAVSFLTKRTDKDVLWTLKFAPGKYILTAQVSSTGLQNTILSSNPKAPAQIMKVDGWNSASSAEYLLSFRMANKVQLNGFEFYGQTKFTSDSNPVWPDQGVYFGSGNIVKVDSNKFYNFGNAALRVVTDAQDPVAGVNSFKTQVSNNTFNNIYQTATTSIDKIHGGTAQSTWNNNSFYNVRGSIKFASRTPGAEKVEFTNNTVNGGDHYGLEIDNYKDFTIKGNTFQNLKQYAMTIYTNGDGNLMSKGFAWGDNFNIANNTIQNVGYAIRYAHNAFWDGTQNIPKNLVIDSNTISSVTNTTSYTPVISVTGGIVDGVQITNNKMSGIINKKYFGVQQGCTNVSILNNLADGVAYSLPLSTALK
jgi:hypothetical protein